MKIPTIQSNSVSGFYSNNHSSKIEQPQAFNTLSDEYATILEKQKQLMITYARLHGGRLPPKKNIKATSGVLGGVKDSLNS